METLTEHGARTIMAQKYIQEIINGDKPILLIGGKPAPYALARIPKAGETRGNLAAGGRGVAQALSARDREIAEALGPTLKQEGLTAERGAEALAIFRVAFSLVSTLTPARPA